MKNAEIANDTLKCLPSFKTQSSKTQVSQNVSFI